MYGELGNKLVFPTQPAQPIVIQTNHLSPKVQHAKRTQSLAHLPPYQTELVRAVAREVRDLDRHVAHLLNSFSEEGFNPSADPATACALLVDHLSMRRNKRCLLAYHRVRTAKLEELCWTGVDVLEQQLPAEEGDPGPMSSQTAGQHSSLSPEEEEYFRQYSDMLAAYKGQWTDVDLTGSLEPPKDLFIDVRVLKDAGEIQTEYGYVIFEGYFLRRTSFPLRPPLSLDAWLLECCADYFYYCRAINLTKNSQLYVRQGDVERLIAQGFLERLS